MRIMSDLEAFLWKFACFVCVCIITVMIVFNMRQQKAVDTQMPIVHDTMIEIDTVYIFDTIKQIYTPKTYVKENIFDTVNEINRE